MRRGWNRHSQELRDIVQAVRRRELCVMAGAGVSKDAGVPLYHELAEELYGEEWVNASDAEKDRPGLFFDRMEAEGRAINADIARVMAQHTSPGDLHRRVIRLVDRSRTRSVITTNWDALLEAAAEREGDAIAMRAWPREKRGEKNGRRAEGVVHLHGEASDPDSMLATDSGLEKHWDKAEEVGFLKGLLEGKTILFVGYSHNDVMIHRMAEELAKAMVGVKMFSIVEVGEYERCRGDGRVLREKLRAAGIGSIVYRTGDEKPHREVAEILNYIEREAEEMRASQERRELEEIGRAGPAKVRDWSRIRQIVTQGGKPLNDLLQEADPVEWGTREMLEEGGLQEYFWSARAKEEQHPVAGWLCSNLDGAKLRNVLWMVRASRGGMPLELRHILGIWLGDKDAALTANERTIGGLALLGEARRWRVTDIDIVILGGIGQRLRASGAHEVTLQTLEEVTTIGGMAETKAAIGEKGEYRDEGTVQAGGTLDGPQVYLFWRETVRPLVEVEGERIWQTCVRSLQRQQAIVDAEGRKDAWNSWSYRRSAVEDHEQDDMDRQTLLGVLVEGARDALTAMEKSGDEGAREWEAAVERHREAASPLIRRIVIHAVGESERWSANRKLAWLLRGNAINDVALVHEVFGLIAKAWGEADEETREKASARFARRRVTKEDGEEAEAYNLRGRCELAEWIRKVGKPGEPLEAEVAKMKGKFPMWKGSDHPDFLHWSSGAYWVAPVAPEDWTAEGLVGRWKERGEAELTAIIREEGRRKDRGPEAWLHGPNEEGMRNAIEEAVKESTEFGLALVETLRKAGAWKHVAWQGVMKAFGGKMDEEGVLRLLQENWWGKVAEGGHAWWIASMLKTAAGRARAEEWSAERAARLRAGVERLMVPLAATDGTESDLDWVTWSINEPGGMAVEAAIELLKGDDVEETERVEALGALRTAQGMELTLHDHVALQAGMQMAWLTHIAREWTSEVVVEELAQAGENGKMRSVLWDGLGFAAWKYPIMVEALKERLVQEVRYPEAPNGAGKGEGSSRDTAAKRFGTCATGQVVFGGDEWRAWTLEGVPASRRERIVRQICSHFDREEEVRSAGGWEKVVKPMWDEILTLQSVGGDAVTPREQRAMLECFDKLDTDQAEEFATRFAKGPPVEPEWFLREREESEVVPNRKAALDVVEHCTEGYKEKAMDHWKWHSVIETLQRWWKEAQGNEGLRWMMDRIDDCLSAMGSRPPR